MRVNANWRDYTYSARWDFGRNTDTAGLSSNLAGKAEEGEGDECVLHVDGMEFRFAVRLNMLGSSRMLVWALI